ncbi:phage holin family protein [Streptomyces sp. LP05-1]|uniref:Phage holin family protein n=1 Tax=Streptomyces pyxinae TaxID=2970734 RepID=A0ABT2CHJ0_9ACTN|nr:phage holin family protein [Streptomyces sp. LP05-1]MCS0636881.1 phage holin family protein [Streptomyces sp. LP05-1]
MPESPQDVIAVVVEEVQNVREELGLTVADAVTETRNGVSAMAAGGACGLLAMLSAHTVLQDRLARVLPEPLAAGALSLVYAGGATALFRYGRTRFRRAREASRETVELSRETVERAVDELAHG